MNRHRQRANDGRVSGIVCKEQFVKFPNQFCFLRVFFSLSLHSNMMSVKFKWILAQPIDLSCSFCICIRHIKITIHLIPFLFYSNENVTFFHGVFCSAHFANLDTLLYISLWMMIFDWIRDKTLLNFRNFKWRSHNCVQCKLRWCGMNYTVKVKYKENGRLFSTWRSTLEPILKDRRIN